MANNQNIAFCFTLNNYNGSEYDEIVSKIQSSSIYYIIGKEVGESGTPHLQGYFVLGKRCRIASLKNKINPRAHFEVARGTAVDNRAYCSKDNDFIEGGDINSCKSRGRRTRDVIVEEYRSCLRDGRRGILEFARRDPGTYGFSGHVLFRNFVSGEIAVERPNIYVEWIYGPPGSGKSREAHERLPQAYIKDPRTKWWNGYCLESNVIIDDFGPNGIDINHLLRWFDRYRCYVEIKGDMCPLHAIYFIVTSNFHPKDCFTDNMGVVHVQYPALERRIVIKEKL